MTREAFGSSMFELADIWTENIDEEEVRGIFNVQRKNCCSLLPSSLACPQGCYVSAKESGRWRQIYFPTVLPY